MLPVTHGSPVSRWFMGMGSPQAGAEMAAPRNLRQTLSVGGDHVRLVLDEFAPPLDVGAAHEQVQQVRLRGRAESATTKKTSTNWVDAPGDDAEGDDPQGEGRHEVDDGQRFMPLHTRKSDGPSRMDRPSPHVFGLDDRPVPGLGVAHRTLT